MRPFPSSPLSPRPPSPLPLPYGYCSCKRASSPLHTFHACHTCHAALCPGTSSRSSWPRTRSAPIASVSRLSGIGCSPTGRDRWTLRQSTGEAATAAQWRTPRQDVTAFGTTREATANKHTTLQSVTAKREHATLRPARESPGSPLNGRNLPFANCHLTFIWNLPFAICHLAFHSRNLPIVVGHVTDAKDARWREAACLAGALGYITAGAICGRRTVCTATHHGVADHRRNDDATFLCALPASSLHPPCTLHAPSMHSPCTLHAPFLHPPCTLPAPSLHPPCTLPAPSMHPPCTLPAPSMHPPCTLPAPPMHSP
eukprot:365672-Chlamydomonas_euryale.AAC.4